MPAGNPVNAPVVLVCVGVVNVYVNGAVPPVGATVKLPVDAPLHNTFNELVTDAVGGGLFDTE